MDNEKRKRLESAGFTVSTVADFLELTPEEEARVEAPVAPSNPYAFERDGLQWTLVKHGVKGEDAQTPGAPSKKIIGFFPKLEIAALRMLENLQRDNCPESPTLEQIRDAIPVATQAVIDAVKALEAK